MFYGDFSLAKAKGEFGLKTVEKRDIFADFTELSASHLLAEILDYQLPIALASNSDKARSELIIAPILVDLSEYYLNNVGKILGILAGFVSQGNGRSASA